MAGRREPLRAHKGYKREQAGPSQAHGRPLWPLARCAIVRRVVGPSRQASQRLGQRSIHSYPPVGTGLGQPNYRPRDSRSQSSLEGGLERLGVGGAGKVAKRGWEKAKEAMGKNEKTTLLLVRAPKYTSSLPFGTGSVLARPAHSARQLSSDPNPGRRMCGTCGMGRCARRQDLCVRGCSARARPALGVGSHSWVLLCPLPGAGRAGRRDILPLVTRA